MWLGFNEADELEYYMFKGEGEWLGQIAQFEPFRQIEGAPNLIMFGHFLTGKPEHAKYTVVVDFDSALATCIHGTVGTILLNMRTMHDCGTGFHCGSDGLRLSAMGAHSRHAGRFDSARFFKS